MRIYLSLIITAILLSFSTAYFALNLQKDQIAGTEEILEIKKIEKDFFKTHAPILELDLSSMYPTRDYFQLIQPIVHTFSEPHYSKECGKPSGRMTKTYEDKAEVWESYRCRETLVLPAQFFEYSPFIHESGMSYAYMAFSSALPPFSDVGWAKKHLNFFHISELQILPPEALDENFKILAGLDNSLFDGIVRGDHYILTGEYYLVRKHQKQGHLFRVYSRMELERFLNTKPYYVKTLTADDKCFLTDGSVCWLKDASNLLQMLRPSSIIIFVASVLILILVSLSLYSRIRSQNQEEERKKHALRVLTHELRTPIANLMLQIESLNKQSDLISPAILEELLKMEGEVYRLKRLAEKSSSYLNSQKNEGLLNFDEREISSMNEFLSHILEDYKGHKIIFYPLKNDQSVVLDAYWFNICFKNLIENAINHGANPIIVTASVQDSFVKIDVTDQGQFRYASLEEMLASEHREHQGQGLGMGLSIVQRIMKEMKGKLVFSKNPTTFSLLVRNKS